MLTIYDIKIAGVIFTSRHEIWCLAGPKHYKLLLKIESRRESYGVDGVHLPAIRMD